MAAYNQAIATWLAGGSSNEVVRSPLRYGENPHQKATLEILGGDLASIGLAQLGGNAQAGERQSRPGVFRAVDLVGNRQRQGDDKTETPRAGAPWAHAPKAPSPH